MYCAHLAWSVPFTSLPLTVRCRCNWSLRWRHNWNWTRRVKKETVKWLSHWIKNPFLCPCSIPADQTFHTRAWRPSWQEQGAIVPPGDFPIELAGGRVSVIVVVVLQLDFKWVIIRSCSLIVFLLGWGDYKKRKRGRMCVGESSNNSGGEFICPASETILVII